MRCHFQIERRSTDRLDGERALCIVARVSTREPFVCNKYSSAGSHCINNTLLYKWSPTPINCSALLHLYIHEHLQYDEGILEQQMPSSK